MAKSGSFPGQIGQLGWAVGMADWLDAPDSPVRRYWRVIENGSAATKWPWQGQEIVGLWGPDARPRDALNGSGTPFSGRRDQKLIPYFRELGQDMLGPARHALWEFMQGGKGPNMDLLKATYYVKVVHKKRKDGSYGPRKTKVVSASTPGQRRKAQKALFYWMMTQSTDASQLPFVSGVVQQPVPAAHHYRKALAAFPLEQEQKLAIQQALGFALSSAGRTPLQKMRNMQAYDNIGGTASRGRMRTYQTNSSLRRYGGYDRAFITIAGAPLVQTLSRDDKGRFVNGEWQKALREANELVARAFQEAVVAEMMKTTHRPTSGELIAATRDPRNRYPRDLG